MIQCSENTDLYEFINATTSTPQLAAKEGQSVIFNCEFDFDANLSDMRQQSVILDWFKFSGKDLAIDHGNPTFDSIITMSQTSDIPGTYINMPARYEGRVVQPKRAFEWPELLRGYNLTFGRLLPSDSGYYFCDAQYHIFEGAEFIFAKFILNQPIHLLNVTGKEFFY